MFVKTEGAEPCTFTRATYTCTFAHTLALTHACTLARLITIMRTDAPMPYGTYLQDVSTSISFFYGIIFRVGGPGGRTRRDHECQRHRARHSATRACVHACVGVSGRHVGMRLCILIFVCMAQRSRRSRPRLLSSLCRPHRRQRHQCLPHQHHHLYMRTCTCARACAYTCMARSGMGRRRWLDGWLGRQRWLDGWMDGWMG